MADGLPEGSGVHAAAMNIITATITASTIRDRIKLKPEIGMGIGAVTGVEIGTKIGIEIEMGTGIIPLSEHVAVDFLAVRILV
jgi:hypothetical protein